MHILKSLLKAVCFNEYNFYMKQMIKPLQITLIILLILDISIWLMAKGGGHIIPLKTNLKFGITGLILLAFWAFISYFGYNKRKNK
jgi:hypothetical protein